MTKPAVELVIVNGRPAVRGECDVSNAREIEAWLGSFEVPVLEVDLSGVSFIDSSGLKALLNVHRRHPNLRIVDPSAAVIRLLEITGTSAVLLRP